MKDKYVIAIDGPAGSGKSSVAKEIAKRLRIKYIDSGALYRAITLALLKKKGSSFTDKDIDDVLQEITLYQEFNDGGDISTYLDGVDVSSDIRSEEVVKYIGIVSDNVEVRDYINKLMRQWAKDYSVIVDGRDIGTVVFPDADIKIYLDASVETRAKRRMKDYIKQGKVGYNLEDIKKAIIKRDNQDKTRKFGALVRAKDAYYLDTSNMTFEEVINYIHNLINNKINAKIELTNND